MPSRAARLRTRASTCALSCLLAPSLAALVMLGSGGTRPLPAQATGPWVMPDDADSLRRYVTEVRSALHAELAALGRPATRVPALELTSRTGLLYYSQQRNALVVPQWSAMSPEARALYARIGGGEAQAREAFDLIAWFYLAHEIAHPFPYEAGVLQQGWDNERRASAWALAFWRGRGEHARLAALRALVGAALPRLAADDPTPPGADRRAHLDAHYAEIVARPVPYAYLQLVMLRELLAATQPQTLAELSAALPPPLP